MTMKNTHTKFQNAPQERRMHSLPLSITLTWGIINSLSSFPTVSPYSCLCSYIGPLLSSNTITRASAVGSLQWLFSLPGMFFLQSHVSLPHLLQVFAQMSPEFSVRPSWTLYLKFRIPSSLSLAFPLLHFSIYFIPIAAPSDIPHVFLFYLLFVWPPSPLEVVSLVQLGFLSVLSTEAFNKYQWKGGKGKGKRIRDKKERGKRRRGRE